MPKQKNPSQTLGIKDQYWFWVEVFTLEAFTKAMAKSSFSQALDLH